MRGARERAELLTSPLLLVSIVVLVVNDHVLKSAWPGLVTGKLSDVAGVVMIAILLTVPFGRAVAIPATAVAFTLLKTVPAFAVWAAPLLGGVTRTDPTDLVALVALVPLWKRLGTVPVGSLPEVWRLPGRMIAVGAAVLATTATSCAGDGVLRLAVDDGVLYAETSDTVFASGDGGVTWSDTGAEYWEEPFESVSFGTARRCGTEEGCLEINGAPDGFVVEEVTASGRQTLFVISDSELRELNDLIEPVCDHAFVADAAVVERNDGRHAVVALTEAGVLHRGPGEQWEWVAVDRFGLTAAEADAQPLGFAVGSIVPDDPWAGLPFQFATAALLLLGPAVALGIVPIRRQSSRTRRDPRVATVLVVALAILLGVLGLGVLVLSSLGDAAQPRVVSAIVLAVAGGIGVAVLVAWQARARRPLPAPDVEHRVG